MSVDIATGAMSLAVTDIALYGKVPATAARSYSTARLHEGTTVLGIGWRDGLDYRLRRTLEGFVYDTPSAGACTFYDPGDELRLRGRLYEPGARLELKSIEQGRFAIVAYGDDRGAIEFVFEPVAGSVNRHYRLAYARNSSDVRVEFDYHQNLLVAARQVREQRMLRFSYDGARRIERVEALTHTGAPLGVHIRYTYDAQGRLARVFDQDGPTYHYLYDERNRIISEQRRSGTIHSFAYDAANRCVHASGGNHVNERWLAYDETTRTTKMRDSHGHESVYVHDERGQVVRAVNPLGESMETTYDEQGRMVARAFPSGYSIAFGYDAIGRKVTTTYPGDRVTTREFDRDHNAVGYTDWRGLKMTIERNDRHLWTAMVFPDGRRWERDYNEFGDIVAMREPGGGTVTLSYDEHSRIRSRRDAGGFLWQYEWNALGLLARRRDASGRLTSYTYDSQQRVTQVDLPDGRQMTYGFDLSGSVLRHRDASGRERSVRYSACGQPLEVRDVEGRVSRFEWDTEQWRMLAFQPPSGATHRFVYDANGDLIEHRHADGTKQSYEWAGRRLVASTDLLGRRFTREYDELDHIVRIANGTDEIVYEYDPLHCAVKKVSTPGSVVEYAYDEFGKPIAEIQNGVELQLGYDDGARRSSIVTSLGDELSFAWDGRNLCASADWGGADMQFAYDEHGHEVERRLGDSGVFRQHFDLGGRLARQEVLTTAGVGVAREFRYTAAGQLSMVNDSHRGWRRIVHDGTDRLVAVDDSRGETRLFGFDPDGNRVWDATIADNHQLIEQVFRAASVPSVGTLDEAVRRGGRETRYRYDAQRRLIEVRSPGRTLEYAYDGAGQVIRRTVIDDDRRRTWEFEWNAFGRLVSVRTPEAALWRYEYDYLGRRIRKIAPEPENSIRYVWDGTTLLYELRNDKRTLYGHHPITQELVFVRDKAARYVVGDHVGAPAELVAGGAIVDRIERDTWGKRQSGTLAAGFPGQWYDEESGLFYNYQRYYDPDMGRYLSPDPVGLRGGYASHAYVASPELFVDPRGEMRLVPGAMVVPADTVDTGGRTQVNRPADGPYMGGHDTVDGQRVDLGGATVTDVVDGDNGTVSHGYNGRSSDESMEAARARNVDAGASTTRWWHSEQNALTAALRGDIPLTGKGPITFDISRPPCDPTHGHGCMDAVVLGYHTADGQEVHSLAQQLADQTKRQVIINYPDPEGDGEASRTHLFNPDGGC